MAKRKAKYQRLSSDKRCKKSQVQKLRANTKSGNTSNNPSTSYDTFTDDDGNAFIGLEENAYEEIISQDLEIETEDAFNVIKGNRIVNLPHVLRWATTLQSNHSKNCKGTLYCTKETNRGLGLVSILEFSCSSCKIKIEKSTEALDKPSVINKGFVYGTLATGSTFSHSEELLALMEIPPMNQKFFINIENNLGEIWKDELSSDMAKAAAEEKKIAEEKGHIDGEGFPYITVYLDGAWSKRSYGHNYSANSGVGVIIGKETGKVLYMGIRNKYCIICAISNNKKELPKAHKCFRNWEGSSCSMESDIIVEGFCFAEKHYNIRFKEFIADGDSSVYRKIIEEVPYGRDVKKMSCFNHILKNYGKALHNLRKDSSVNEKTRAKLSVALIKSLQSVTTKCVYEQSKTKNKVLLREHLLNSVNHSFGDHSHCVEYFCKSCGEKSANIEEIKGSGLFNHVLAILEKFILVKIDQITDKVTNNKAENFMNVVARFTSGKRLNLTNRGSFESRCVTSALRYNNGFEWHYNPLSKVNEEQSSPIIQNYIEKHKKQSICRRERRATRLATRKKTSLQNSIDYGPKAISDPESNDLEIQERSREICKNLKIPEEQAKFIEANTKNQFDSELFITERKNRLTASNFGLVINRRKTTHCHNLVKSILYNSFQGNEATDWGKRNELVAIKQFEKLKNVEVEKSGFFVDLETGYLGASPDGLVKNCDAIVEVKCLYSIFKKNISLVEAVQLKNISICLEMVEGKLRLKRHHNYYYQIQGQLNISNRKTCYFIVYTGGELFVEEITKDSELWRNKMLPTLSKFFENCLLQEIVRKRVPRKLRCFDPDNDNKQD